MVKGENYHFVETDIDSPRKRSSETRRTAEQENQEQTSYTNKRNSIVPLFGRWIVVLTLFLKQRLLRLLYWNQSWLGFILIVFVLIVGTYFAVQEQHFSLDNYRDQMLRSGLASELAHRIDLELRKTSVPSPLLFYRAAKPLNDLFPEIDPFILDSRGNVLFKLSATNDGGPAPIPLETIEALLGNRSLTNGPILGPNSGDRSTGPISVAPLAVPGLNGFVYIGLHNHARWWLSIPWSEQWAWQNAFWLTILGIAIMAAVIYAFQLLFKRIVNRLTGVVKTLAPELSSPAAAVAGYSDLRAYENAVVELVSEIARDRSSLLGKEKETSKVISQLSHDFRTPLFLIQDYADRLISDEENLGPADQKQEAERIKRNVKSLVTLVSDLDAFEKLKSTHQRISREIHHIIELADDLHLIYGPHAEKAGVCFQLDVNDGLPSVWADISLIERALRNLIENAIRHTSAGGNVTLKLWEVSDSLVRVEVKDTGCGIPEKELPHIFEPFRQVCREKRNNGSSGLGLAIVEQVIRAHGSEIHVESTEHVGTTFWFELPQKPS